MSSTIQPGMMAGANGSQGAGTSVPTGGPPPAAGMEGLFAGSAPGSGDPGAAQSAAQGISEMVVQLDQLLSQLATVCGQQGGPKIAQARQLIKQGSAEFLTSVGASSTSSSPTSPGTNFPGGGFTS